MCQDGSSPSFVCSPPAGNTARVLLQRRIHYNAEAHSAETVSGVFLLAIFLCHSIKFCQEKHISLLLRVHKYTTQKQIMNAVIKVWQPRLKT